MNLEKKIDSIKKIINDNGDIDGDYWYYEGDESIHQILDTFNEKEWLSFIEELNNFTDDERYQFCCTLLNYDNNRIVKIVDIYEIFFTQYLLLPLEDASWIMQDIMYVENIRQPNLDLLKKLRQKVETIRNFKNTDWEENTFLWAENIIDKVIEKHLH
ncbi:hypothetical protein PQ462_06595 [Flavobacterium sp. KACC 22758]|uniref:hypothetical protein n=1 Tax=Flavobacterium sp. KACC 22758 TaxID=3025667 RepID=UPI002366AD08|nr:hypothetical protein [Flavobacterium sp. KACC 22758]WDF61029.1 hypothetical protein PQ462_06595 [Flavobacterium sp. KACC 22758]